MTESLLRSPLRLLNDAAHTLESLDGPEKRLKAVLRLLCDLVPCDGCVLLEAPNGDEPRFTFLPKPADGDLLSLKAAMTRCLQMIASDGSGPLTGETAPQIAASLPWASYLGLPLVGNDRVTGLLFVGANKPDAYGEQDLSVLSVVASQIAAYLTALTYYRRQTAVAEELHRSQEYGRHLFQSSLIGILEIEGDRITNANDAFLSIVGYTRDDLERGALNWRAMTPPDYLHLAERALKEAETTGEATPYEKEWYRKDGTSVPVLVGATLTEKSPPRWVSFVLDLTERKRIEADLERTRSEFLGEVSHELKTPLTAIKGSAAMALAGEGPTPAEARELFQVIDEQSERLRELISNLLDMTRVEAGSLGVKPQPADLSRLAKEAVDTFSRSVADRPIDIDLPPSLPAVMADRRRTVQVLSNLLSNADKASPPRAPIAVSAEAAASEVIVRVRDLGRGIPPEKMPLLFKKFARVHESGGRSTGLGLAICKGIVESHGGRIWAESGGIGEGATFCFTLPIADDASKTADG
ncbi:MAG: ATP-binding protein [Dehalococcoidia bacterium]